VLEHSQTATNDVAVWHFILWRGGEDSIGSTPRQVLCCFSASQALTMIFRNLFIISEPSWTDFHHQYLSMVDNSTQSLFCVQVQLQRGSGE
jgi:hypothetical protein